MFLPLVRRAAPSKSAVARTFSPAVLLASALTLTLPVAAEVRLHPLFSDHGILQRGIRVPVWGTGDEGERVTVEFAGQKVSTTAHNGRWQVSLSPLKASNHGAVLKASGPANATEVTDVVVGEVWICSGQSNMEWPLSRSYQPEADIQASANPNLRLFTVAKRRSPEAKTDLDYAKHSWAVAGPDTVKNFSAVGYYFGRNLEEDLKSQGVPVGLIHTSWGGSPAEVWMSDSAIRANPSYARDLQEADAAAYLGYQKGLLAWETEKAAAVAKGEAFTKNRPFAPWQNSELYNGMIANLIPYAIKGAIWYQGESNAGRAWQYRELYGDMIKNWRRDWGQGDFHFYAVQLAPWDKSRRREMSVIASEVGDSNWAELREAQDFVAATVPNTGVAVITDVGDKDDIHPTRKAPVGARLALLARSKAYHEPVESSGPVVRTFTFVGGEALLDFSHVGSRLQTRDGLAPTGFSVAGEDHKFHAATARIRGKSEIVVQSSEVAKPVAVRYGWADYPVVNLRNGAGLPASPFRTDSWELTTQKKP